MVDLIKRDGYEFFVDKWFTVYKQEATLKYEVKAAPYTVAESRSCITVFNAFVGLKENILVSGFIDR